MAQNNSPIINFSSSELKDIKAFCKLNELDMDEFVKICFNQGYQIEKYGLLNADGVKVVEKEVIKEVRVEVPVEKVVEKEVIKEVPVEIIKEVEKIITKNIPVEKEVIKEVTVEVIKEVEKPVEKVVTKEVYIKDDEEVQELGNKIAKLEEEIQKEKEEYKQKIDEKENEKSELKRRISELEILLEEKPKEVIKEIEVIKEVKSQGSPEKLKGLQNTIQKLKEEIREKDKSISQYEQIMLELDKEFKNQTATYLASTNLNREL